MRAKTTDETTRGAGGEGVKVGAGGRTTVEAPVCLLPCLSDLSVNAVACNVKQGLVPIFGLLTLLSPRFVFYNSITSTIVVKCRLNRFQFAREPEACVVRSTPAYPCKCL